MFPKLNKIMGVVYRTLVYHEVFTAVREPIWQVVVLQVIGSELMVRFHSKKYSEYFSVLRGFLIAVILSMSKTQSSVSSTMEASGMDWVRDLTRRHISVLDTLMFGIAQIKIKT